MKNNLKLTVAMSILLVVGLVVGITVEHFWKEKPEPAADATPIAEEGCVGGKLLVCREDQDRDGFLPGETEVTVQACPCPGGFVLITNPVHSGVDCDDLHADSYPGAAEICDGADNNCDGMVDEGLKKTFYPDEDHDGFGSNTETGSQSCFKPTGHYVANNTDCDDADKTIYLGAVELCDDKDNDCDGQGDEKVKMAPVRRWNDVGGGYWEIVNAPCPIPQRLIDIRFKPGN